MIQRREKRVRVKKVRHLRIKIDQRDALDLRILQDFTHRQAIATAQHQYAAQNGNSREAGMYERLMVAVFIARTKLEMRVEKKPEVVFPSRQDNVLIVRVAGKDDLVGVDVIFGQPGNAFAVRE